MEAANGSQSGRTSRSGPTSSSPWSDGKPLDLTVRELQLLTALVERRDRIVSREELYPVVWGEPYRKSDRSVDVYVGQAAPEARRGRCPARASSTRISASATASHLFHKTATAR